MENQLTGLIYILSYNNLGNVLLIILRRYKKFNTDHILRGSLDYFDSDGILIVSYSAAAMLIQYVYIA